VTDRSSHGCTSEDRPHSRQFESFSMDCLSAGLRVRFQARGASMASTIRDGEMVYVRPASEADLRRGDIVLVKNGFGFRLHRLVRADAGRDLFITRGDGALQDDPAVGRDQILGVAVAKDVRIGTKTLRANFRGMSGRVLRIAARGQAAAAKLARLAGMLRPFHVTLLLRAAGAPALRGRPQPGTRRLADPPKLLGGLALLIVSLAASQAHAQVAVDSVNSVSGTLGPGTSTGTYTHTIGTGTNRLLVVE
jgi:hypothetical protein